MHPVYHESLLTPYVEPPSHRRDAQPLPDIIDDEPEYEVESILKRRRRGANNFEYLVKWKGYGNHDNTWQTEADLEHAQDILNDFKRNLPPPQQLRNRGLITLPKGHWDYLIRRYKAKNESLPYDERLLFEPALNEFLLVDGDRRP